MEERGEGVDSPPAEASERQERVKEGQGKVSPGRRRRRWRRWGDEVGRTSAEWDKVQWEHERRWIGLPRQRRRYVKALEAHADEPEAQQALAQARVFERWVQEKRRREEEEEARRALFFEMPQVGPRVPPDIDFLDNWFARLERKWSLS